MAVIDAEVGGSPWPGLLPYTAADAGRFFGRERVVRQILRMLEQRGVAGVVGPSGSGKSSLLSAGLASAGIRVHVMRPGADPNAELQRHRAQRDADASDDGILVVDQLEEVFTVVGEDEREMFLDSLADLVRNGVRVAFALRSDHYGSCAGYPRFADIAAAAHALVGPPTEMELREIVCRPAELAAIAIPDDLVSEIVDEVLGEPGALPLVSHVLAETFRGSPQGRLEWDAYRAAGGVRGAIARSAENVWQGLPPEQQQQARAMLVQLAEPGGGALDVSRRLPVARLVPLGDVGRRATLDALAAARILSIDGTNVEVAHEAVFREWPRLRTWLTEDRDQVRALNNLRHAAQSWDEAGRPDSALLRGSTLESAQQLATGPNSAVGTVEREFVDISAAAASVELRDALGRETAMRRANARLRMAFVAVATLMIVAVTVGVSAWRRADEVRTERDIADARRLAAASGTLRGDNIDLAALTAAEAFDLHGDDQTVGSMLSAATAQPGLVAYLHDDQSFTAASLGSEGKLLLIDDDESEYGVWDVSAPSPRRIGALPTPDGARVALVLFVNEEVAVIGDQAGNLTAYHVPDQQRLWTSRLGDAALTAISSRGGQLLAVGDDDGTVHIIDATDGRVLRTVSATGSIAAIAVTAGGDVVSAASSTEVSSWRVADLLPSGPTLSVDVEVWSMEYGPANDVLAVGTETDLRLIDPSTGDAIGPAVDAHSGIVHDIVFANAGVLVTVGEDGRVAFWDVSTMTPARPPLSGHAAGVLAVDVDLSTGTLVTAGEDLRAGVWNLGLRTSVSTPVDMDGADGQARSVEDPLRPGDDAGVAVSPTGLIAAAGRDGRVRFARTDQLAAPAGIDAFDEPLSAVALSNDGSIVAVATAEGSAQAFDVEVGEPLTPVLEVGSRSTSVAIDSTARWLAVAQTDAECDACTLVFDLRSPTTPPMRLQPSSRPADETPRPGYAVAFSATGSRLVAGDNAGYVDVWDLGATDPPAPQSVWHTKLERGIRSLTFSHDGSRVAIGANGGLLLVVDANDGSELLRLGGHRGRVAGVAFSPDDSLLATVGPDDATARTWVMSTGLAFSPAIPTGTSWVAVPSWSVDGRDLLVETAWGGVIAYHLDQERLRNAMCVLANRNLSEREWDQYVGDARRYETTCAEVVGGD